MSKSKVARSENRNTTPAPREPEPASERRIKAAATVNVPEHWFSTAFGVAFGERTSEVCERVSDELRALVHAHRESPAVIGGDEFVHLVERVQWRLSVAAEWAQRIERAAEVQS